MRDDSQLQTDKCWLKTKLCKYTKKFKQMYGELKTSKDINSLQGIWFIETNDMGHDYAKYTSSMTKVEKL